jgi:hypothetical protein
MDGWGSNPGMGKRFFSPPKRRDRLWGPSSPISKGQWPMANGHWAMKLATELHLVPRSRIVELYLNFLILLRGTVLN